MDWGAIGETEWHSTSDTESNAESTADDFLTMHNEDDFLFQVDTLLHSLDGQNTTYRDHTVHGDGGSDRARPLAEQRHAGAGVGAHHRRHAAPAAHANVGASDTVPQQIHHGDEMAAALSGTTMAFMEPDLPQSLARNGSDAGWVPAAVKTEELTASTRSPPPFVEAPTTTRPQGDTGTARRGRKRPVHDTAPPSEDRAHSGSDDDFSPSSKTRRAGGDAAHAAKVVDSTAADGDDDEDTRWQRLIELLADNSFFPGTRPDLIEGAHVTPGLMFKEHPKRRRAHSSGSQHKDKWFNTGGIKSASDRFDPVSGLGLRKRYGKVVRDNGRPVLKFQEFSLLRRVQGTLTEPKNGPTIFHIMQPGAKRGSAIALGGPRGAGGITIASDGAPPGDGAVVTSEEQGTTVAAQEQEEEVVKPSRGGGRTRRRQFKVPPGC